MMRRRLGRVAGWHIDIGDEESDVVWVGSVRRRDGPATVWRRRAQCDDNRSACGSEALRGNMVRDRAVPESISKEVCGRHDRDVQLARRWQSGRREPMPQIEWRGHNGGWNGQGRGRRDEREVES